MNDTILSHHLRAIKLIENACYPNRRNESICPDCGNLNTWDHAEKCFECQNAH